MKIDNKDLIYRDFSSSLESFFKEYLVQERGCSIKTIHAYRDAFVLLIEFMGTVKNISPEEISMEMINRDTVLSYLNWLEDVRGCSIGTRNSRLAAMKSFCRYLMHKDPCHLKQWNLILEMRMKKQPEMAKVDSIPLSGIKAMLQEVDIQTRSGLRDLTLLSLLYNSAARVNELIELMPKSLRLQKPYGVELFGKGAKRRVVPLDEPIVKLLETYLQEYGLNKDGFDSHPLFFNRYHGKLTNSGITYLLKKYAKKAQDAGADDLPDNIHPHLLRHSRACHLLQAGTNLEYIRLILGHSSIQTTEIYAKADPSAMHMAVENAYCDIGISQPEERQWQQNPKLLMMLKSLA